MAAWAAMDEASLYRLLEDLKAGAVTPDEVVRRMRRLPYADLGFARVDHHRALRQGLPEAVYAPGKSVAQCVAIVGELLAETGGAPLSCHARMTSRRPHHLRPTRTACAKAPRLYGAQPQPAPNL